MLLEEFPFEPGFRLTDGDVLNKVAAEPAYSVDNSVTATGTTQATAYNIRATVTSITAGGNQTGVKLPPPKVGRVLYLMNYTATSKKIYPFDLEVINNAPSADLAFGMAAILVCTGNTSWMAAMVAADSTTGDIIIDAADADTPTSDGHHVNITGGAGGTTSGNGGAITIASGPATGSAGDAGDITILGAISTNGQGGSVTIAAGTGATKGVVTLVDNVVVGSVVAGTSTEIKSPVTKVDGAVTLSAPGVALSITNNATVGGTLTVAGNTTVGALAVTNNETVGGTITVTGSATVGSLAVTNNATVGGTLGVTGAVTMSSTLGVTGASIFAGTARFNGVIGFNNTAPVARPTGWGPPTGTATRTTFDTGTVTLSVLAEHVKALIDDLTAYGLIGP